MSQDDLGDRMKMYENREASERFMPLLPVYARIDGRGFSKFTRGLKMPYDEDFRRAMIDTTKFLVEKTQARLGYTQSDEISLCWLADPEGGSVFFDARKQKMVSQLAALASVRFARALSESSNPLLREKASLDPTFDARAYSLPNKMECANAFVWRENDATKNALSMAVRTLYSHKQVEGKGRAEQHEMLFEKGINFNDYPDAFKRGVYVRREVVARPLTQEEIERIPEDRRPPAGQLVQRSRIMEVDMPIMARVSNKVDVIFDGASPVLFAEATPVEETQPTPRASSRQPR
jgi:tRNA(His) guanylyltransferase